MNIVLSFDMNQHAIKFIHEDEQRFYKYNVSLSIA